MKRIKISYNQLEKDIKELALKMNDITFNGIYAIPRGGVPVGIELSHLLKLPLIKKKDITKDTLIVDDLIDSGETIEDWVKTNVVAVLYRKPYSPNYENLITVREIKGWIEMPYEQENKKETIENNITRILQFIGEDPTREGLLDTPKRVAKMYEEIFSGYNQDPASLFKAVFSSDTDEMVIVKDIPFYSHCEHHLVSFFGKAHIGYIPKGKVLGLSKFARLVDIFAKRLQIQEQLTYQIANEIEKYLKPLGVMVVIEAEHLCMSMRGVKKPNSRTVTSVTKGVFRKNTQARQEFLELIK